MTSRPLKVGEYRKVKTWDELLATAGLKRDPSDDSIEAYHNGSNVWFFESGEVYCGTIVKIHEQVDVGVFKIDDYCEPLIAEFFTDDHYDENGNEVKMEGTVELIEGVTKVKCIRDDFVDLTIDKIYTINRLDLDEVDNPFSVIDDNGVEGFYIKSRFQILAQLDPLDLLEATTKQDIANSNKVLDQIALMREIDLKQVEMEKMGKELEQMIDELKELMNG